MNICAVVILYYPDASINASIFSYLPLVNKLYIIDNSESSQIANLDAAILQSKNVEYFHDSKNRGIAERLNMACSLSIESGFEYILTMDQDSSFASGDTEKYFQLISKFEFFNNVGMFGVRHTSIKDDKADAYSEVKQLITSGSVINLKNFEKIGAFDNNLFIDQVDSEYCFKILKAGLKIIQFDTICLNHNLGVTSNYTSLKSFEKTPRSLHSPIRIYYMVRNYFYVSSKYQGEFIEQLDDIKKDVLNRIKNNFLYGKSRWKVLKYVIKGIIDYKKGKMGKISA